MIQHSEKGWRRGMPALLLTVAGLSFFACGAGTTEFKAEDGSVKATMDNRTGEWHITGDDGREVVPDYDSMRVVEKSEEGHPMTVVYYKGETQHWRQYYSTMQLRSEGDIVGQERHGRWVFYHPNGNIQVEATYVYGKEEGTYKVFRDNGAPYYIGQYHEGKRVGTWEVYDAEGNLVQTEEYGEQ